MKYFLILTFSFFIYTGDAFSQIIGGDLFVNISGSVNYFLGDKLVGSGNYIAPALYGNFETTYSYRVEFEHTLTKKMSAFASIGHGQMQNWEYQNEIHYYESEIAENSFRVGIGIINPFRASENRMRYKYSIKSGIGFRSLSFSQENMVSGLEGGTTFHVDPVKVKNINPGAFISIGLTYFPSMRFGIFAETGINVYSESFLFTPESRSVYVPLTFGVSYIFFQDKKYYF